MKGQRFSAYVVMLLLGVGVARPAAGAVTVFDHSHVQWDTWLKKYVRVEGSVSQVDYGAAKKEPAGLKAYLEILEQVTRPQYDSFSDKQKLAFLINAYNAFTVKLILDHYPVKSIKDTGSLFRSPWKKKFFTFLGEKQHLDGIEHGRIRKEFKEPRIHFAVVCASLGCPMLRNEAWVSERLEEQLDASTRLFLGDRNRNRYEKAENRLYLSKLFDWYEEDFEKASGSVAAFVAPYLGADAATRKVMLKAKISHLDYDWNLNDVKPKSPR